MGSLTLEKLFGQGSYQDAFLIRIPKGNLPRLTPSGNNSVAQILAGLCNRMTSFFSGEITANGRALKAGSEPLTYDYTLIYLGVNVLFWETQYTTDALNRPIKNKVIVFQFLLPEEGSSELNPNEVVSLP